MPDSVSYTWLAGLAACLLTVACAYIATYIKAYRWSAGYGAESGSLCNFIAGMVSIITGMTYLWLWWCGRIVLDKALTLIIAYFPA